MPGRGLRLLFLTAFSYAASSCASGPRHPNWPPLPGVTVTVRLWVEDSPNLDKDDLMKGCMGWRHKGVTCVATANVMAADIRVHEDTKDCVKNKDDDYYTLAYAYRGGDIHVRTKCFFWGKKINAAKLRTVVTHEVGHELGIWEHVPLECTGKAPVHPTGKAICGPAVMNPIYDSGVPEITEIDGLAFDVRDLNVAVVADHEGPKGGPDCVYTGH